MKDRPILFSAPMVRALLAGTKSQTRRALRPRPFGADQIFQFGHGFSVGRLRDSENAIRTIRCPYGVPGDRLWVREAWSTHGCFDSVRPAELTSRSIHYWADGDCQTGKRLPGIFMPRWASRTTLEVVEVRVERLLSISKADAVAEGIPSSPDVNPVHAYADLWDSINGSGASRWVFDPFVWVVCFRRVQ